MLRGSLSGLTATILLLAGCSEEPGVYTPSEKMAVDAYHSGDIEGTLAALDAAMSTGAAPADPVRFTGRFSGMISVPLGDEPPLEYR